MELPVIMTRKVLLIRDHGRMGKHQYRPFFG